MLSYAPCDGKIQCLGRVYGGSHECFHSVPKTLGRRRPRHQRVGDGRTSSDRLECSASHLKRRQPRHDIVLIVYLPRRAINIDVLPEPVGPTMRLMCPFLKSSSPSIRSLNGRVPLPGVEGISVSFNHVKHAPLH